MISIPTRRQRLNGILKTGFRIWKGSFRAVVPFSLLFALATITYETLLSRFGLEYDLRYNVFFYYSENNSKYFLITLVFLALVFILNSGMIYQMHQATQKTRLKFHDGLLVGFEKSFMFFMVCFLAFLMIIFGTLLFVVPGVIFSVCVIFSPYLVVISKNGILSSIRESFRLVSGHWWFTATVFFVITLGFLAFSVLFGVVTISAEALQSLVSGKAFNFHDNGRIAMMTDFLIITFLYPLFCSCNLALLYSLQASEKKRKH